jgi:hypothetical protein
MSCARLNHWRVYGPLRLDLKMKQEQNAGCSVFFVESMMLFPPLICAGGSLKDKTPFDFRKIDRERALLLQADQVKVDTLIQTTY